MPEIREKPDAPVFALGLMSGTSADGLDLALVKVFPPDGRVKLIDFQNVRYPVWLQRRIKNVAEPDGGTVAELCKLNAYLGHFFADCVRTFLQERKLAPDEVAFIGSHGQTVAHFPEEETWGEVPFRSTLQIGDPAVVAARTGILTVGDFRPADMALGGQGAPLVPLFDFLQFRHESRVRLLVNIGGIANLTFLPAGAKAEDVLAFDTGPGNVLLDELARRYFSLPFDQNGEIAARGKVSDEVVTLLLQDPYFSRRPPKSTGSEYFLGPFLRHFDELAAVHSLRPEDRMATAAELTARSIFLATERFVTASVEIGEVIVSGGGAENAFLMERLSRHFSACAVRKSDAYGVPSRAKEAMCFAALAFRTLHGLAANLPQATGAAEPAILGKICLPEKRVGIHWNSEKRSMS